MSKTVYFLGAGSTKAVAPDAPLNRDLVKKALNRFRDTPEAKRLQEFIVRDLYGRSDPPIDNQIWNFFDYVIQQRKSPSTQINLEQIINLKNDLMYLLILEFEESLKEVDLKPFERFVTNIQSKNPTIISTNYDILIDNALYKIAEKYNYGVKIRRTVSKTDEGHQELTGISRPDIETRANVNAGNISLLKLHGSLNWIYCSKCKEVDVTMWEKGAKRAFEGLYCVNKYCTCKYDTLLITPTMYKNYENRIIRETWECAENELRNANEIVFIGYALKEEDYQIRCLLMKSMFSKKSGNTKITVIEKEPTSNIEEEESEKIKENYKNLYGEIVFQPIGFKKYINMIGG